MGGAVSSGGQGGANAGAAGTGGGSAGAGGGGGYPLKNPPVPSAGCGKSPGVTTSATYRTIMSGGDQRQYMITLPANYDMSKPHRFIYASHGQGGEGSDITREKYYSIQNIAEAADSTIFVAASGLGGSWGLKDVPLFDDILAFVKQNACVDESRVFVLGFSFGGMYSYSLSMTRQKVIRAGIGMSPANFNIQIPPKMHEPIAWMQSTGMSDGICPWVNNEGMKRGAKFIAMEHGADSGCMVPDPIPTWKSGGMLCVDFAGCKPGYPVKACTFNGGHGLPGGFSGAATWMWDFISQF
jgi:poly(3-hydroxybutyrate) depolymerase